MPNSGLAVHQAAMPPVIAVRLASHSKFKRKGWTVRAAADGDLRRPRRPAGSVTGRFGLVNGWLTRAEVSLLPSLPAGPPASAGRADLVPKQERT